MAAALLALLAGCGQTPTLTLQLGTSTASVLRGDQGTVAVTITRGGGASDPVTLSVSGAPANVVATFADATLAAGETSTTLLVQVDAAASEATTDLTIEATSGSLAASATLALDVTSLTVDGTVLGLLGDGFAGAIVAIQGTTVFTDPNGAFTIAGVSVPYDLLVHHTFGTTDASHVFVGMTSANPAVTAYGSLAASNVTGYYPSATISGDLDTPVPAGSQGKVCVEGTGSVVTGCATVEPGNTTYNITARWLQGTNVSFRLHALVTQLDADALPTGYDGYGTATGSVGDDATTTVDVTLGLPPATQPMTFEVNPPAGFDANGLGAGIKLSPTFTLPVFAGSPPSASVTVPVPQFADASYIAQGTARHLTSTATTMAWQQGLPPTGTVTFDLAAPPPLLAPADGATGVGVGDTFSLVTTGVPATFVLMAGSDAILVTTMANAITIPDLTSVGGGLQPGATYTWSAYLSPTSATIEEAAENWLTDYYGALDALTAGGPGSRVETGTIRVTASRTFSTP